jgi:hypothetical protein
MKRTVIHHNGHWQRVPAGKIQVLQQAQTVYLPGEEPMRGSAYHPVFYSIFIDDTLIARASRLELKRGRRYPDTEHYFIY